MLLNFVYSAIPVNHFETYLDETMMNSSETNSNHGIQQMIDEDDDSISPIEIKITISVTTYNSFHPSKRLHFKTSSMCVTQMLLTCNGSVIFKSN